MPAVCPAGPEPMMMTLRGSLMMDRAYCRPNESSPSESVREAHVDDVDGVRDGAEIHRPLCAIAIATVGTRLRARNGIALVARRACEAVRAARVGIGTALVCEEDVS